MKTYGSLLLAAFFLTGFLCAGFEYPQPTQSSADIGTFFAQSLTETFSNGITFVQTDEVSAADSGRLLITMNEPRSPFEFSSTLGTMVIIAHSDKMISVYGNIDKVILPPQTKNVGSGEYLGTSGRSAWQKKPAGLMFLTCDTKNGNSFNPFILLPQFEKSVAPLLRSIVLVNRRGTTYDLPQTKTLPADSYLIYREHTAGDTIPYRVVVLVNGSEAESADFNIIRQNNSYLEIAGKRSFPFATVYHSSQHQLLAALTLANGRAMISISVSDMAGNTRTASFTVDVQ